MDLEQIKKEVEDRLNRSEQIQLAASLLSDDITHPFEIDEKRAEELCELLDVGDLEALASATFKALPTSNQDEFIFMRSEDPVIEAPTTLRDELVHEALNEIKEKFTLEQIQQIARG